MPASSGKHSVASRIIKDLYNSKCLFCDSTINVTMAHLVAGKSGHNYKPFGKPTYLTDLDVKSPRNYIPLCGRLGEAETCHNEFDKFLMTLIYNPIKSIYKIYCFRTDFSNYISLNEKEVKIDPTNEYRPYARLLAWRSRFCLGNHGCLIPDEVENIITLANLSEESKSMTKEKNYEEEADDEEEGSIEK